MPFQPFVGLKKTGLIAAITFCCVTFAQMGSAQTVKTARLGHSFTDHHPRGIAMQKFADEVNKATNGEIKIDVFGSASLGSEQQMLQATQSNVQQFYLGSVSPLAGRQKTLQIFDFPFLFQNHDEVANVLDGPVGQEMLKNLSKLRLYGLTWSGGAFRDLANNKHAVNTMADMKGLKIRVMPTKVAIDSFQIIGMNPVPLSYTEVFTALETGVLDGHEHPVVDMYQNKVYEVEKYFTVTRHVYTPVVLVVAEKWFDALTPQQKDIIHKVAQETQVFQRAEEIRQADDAVNQLEQAGMQISVLPPEELDKIRTVVKPVIEKHTDIIGADFVKKFIDEIEKVRQQTVQ
ncbi:DctP family TRAP transporter solute-binding subunit [Brenneria goodwinii]|uniref:TRAP-type C4-dicarboxylate transport system, periplasmic component n=1 Tax=Brenneria goodwinii TaxID=1109412 RepID=A0A0G4JQL8_9GAMM|nr:DctP family TRAP transporter solute-binding subunit [Brenneria goodwinii]CPR14215.1 TRAP-type C4-dicarboxylate transport system, periplasmic component [Brenneria goodwinii]